MTEFIGTCVHLSERDLNCYDESERIISNRTFRKHIGSEQYLDFEKSLGYDKNLRLADDWAVSYGKGKWRGRPCVCCHWSSIHHIFTI